MNGAELLLQTAVEHGVDVCFANPGTTEMELVGALDAVPGMRGVLGLFEGVVTGAADGYGRVTGRPALTLLHLGPGFANGIANLHNARRAHTPVVNLIGDHATWHLGADAPAHQRHRVPGPARCRATSSASSGASHAGSAMLEAIAAAVGPPSGVATLIVPQDAAWGAADLHDVGMPPDVEAPVDGDAVGAAASELRGGDGVAILLGGCRPAGRAGGGAAHRRRTPGPPSGSTRSPPCSSRAAVCPPSTPSRTSPSRPSTRWPASAR